MSFTTRQLLFWTTLTGLVLAAELYIPLGLNVFVTTFVLAIGITFTFAKRSISRLFLFVIAAIFLFQPVLMVTIFIHQWSPIYNAEFLKAENHLKQIPNIKIVDSWKHDDITLEDFGFTIQVGDGPLFRLNFFGGDFPRNWQQGTIRGVILRDDRHEWKFSKQVLRDNGTPVRNLDDILIQLPNILQRTKDQKPLERKTWGLFDESWVCLEFDGQLQ